MDKERITVANFIVDCVCWNGNVEFINVHSSSMVCNGDFDLFVQVYQRTSFLAIFAFCNNCNDVSPNSSSFFVGICYFLYSAEFIDGSPCTANFNNGWIIWKKS